MLASIVHRLIASSLVAGKALNYFMPPFERRMWYYAHRHPLPQSTGKLHLTVKHSTGSRASVWFWREGGVLDGSACISRSGCRTGRGWHWTHPYQNSGSLKLFIVKTPAFQNSTAGFGTEPTLMESNRRVQHAVPCQKDAQRILDVCLVHSASRVDPDACRVLPFTFLSLHCTRHLGFHPRKNIVLVSYAKMCITASALHRYHNNRRKPPVPRRDERPPMGLHSGKNFVTANAVEAILAVPSNRHRPPIDYLGKEDFGRVPVRIGCARLSLPCLVAHLYRHGATTLLLGDVHPFLARSRYF